MQKPNSKNGKKQNTRKKICDPIPERFESLEAAADFWDTHDLTDYRGEFREVKDVKIDLAPQRFRLEDELAKKINKLAHRRGVSTETLINLWLQQKLSETLRSGKRRPSSKLAAISQSV